MKKIPTRLLEEPKKNASGAYVFITDVGVLYSKQIAKLIGVDAGAFINRLNKRGWRDSSIFTIGPIPKPTHCFGNLNTRITSDRLAKLNQLKAGTWEREHIPDKLPVDPDYVP